MDDSDSRDNAAAAPPPGEDVAEPSSRGGPELGEPTLPHSSNELFECCVCLDLLYKPIVLVCGHIACFWCVHKAMNGIVESHCPMCRHPYKYFPAICQLLHNLLRKVEPAYYERRRKEVLETESEHDCFSPQFVDSFTEDMVHTCTPLVKQNTSSITDAPRESACVGKGNSYVNADDLDIDGLIISKHGKSLENVLGNEASHNLCIFDALCAGCKQLLFQPAVLNCGHVYCEPCLLSLGNESPRCQVCHSVHPGDLPKVCLQLSNFLENKFPIEYAQRRESFQDLLSGGCQANKHNIQLSNHRRALSAEDKLKIHPHVGCDSCGMYPIVGKRYKCRDCKESVGFDLCEACYDTRSKLPARFNQQHTADHTFVLDESMMFVADHTFVLDELMMLVRVFSGFRRQDPDEDSSGDPTEAENPDSTAGNS